MFKGYTGLPWTGGGPLIIADECTAERHNTLAAARGKLYTAHTRVDRGVKCVCPRALALVKAENEARRKAGRKTYKRKGGNGNTPGRGAQLDTQRAGLWVAKGTPFAPDLSTGRCRDETAMKSFDLALTGVGNARVTGERQAKRLCALCPRRSLCAEYVRAGEGTQPGIWGGVWAGRTAKERKAGAQHA